MWTELEELHIKYKMYKENIQLSLLFVFPHEWKYSTELTTMKMLYHLLLPHIALGST